MRISLVFDAVNFKSWAIDSAAGALRSLWSLILGPPSIISIRESNRDGTDSSWQPIGNPVKGLTFSKIWQRTIFAVHAR